ncbi:hypothetical protein HDU86_007731 [Geranomyces michiganensis]|nr:hypothetical protein HDU86_007731 [Geranomyces michiganensis]
MGLYASGTIINLAIYAYKAAAGDEPSFFYGYDSVLALTVVLLNAFIGIAITYVYKYADAVVKSIAGSVTTGLLVILSAVLFGARVTILTGTGSLIIFTSTYIYMVRGPSSRSMPNSDQTTRNTVLPVKASAHDNDNEDAETVVVPEKLRRRPKLGACVLISLFLILAHVAMQSYDETSKHAAFGGVEQPPLVVEPSTIALLPTRANSVAYCITGDMRGMAAPAAHKSFRDNVLEVFTPKTDPPLIADTFYQVRMDMDSAFTVQQVALALDYLRPTEFIALPYIDEVPDNHCTTPPHTYPPASPDLTGARFYKQFRKVQNCYQHVQRREISQGWKYDILVRARPDMVWEDTYPISVYNASREQVGIRAYPPGWGSVSDHWAVVPRALGDIYFNAADVWLNCTTFDDFATHCPGHPRRGHPDEFNQECYLGKWLRDHNIVPVEYFNKFKLSNSQGETYKVTLARRYTPEHEWVSLDASSGVGTIGITEYAAKALGDVVFVEIPTVGTAVDAKEQLSAVESVKAASDVYAPISGEVVEVNEELGNEPSLINSSPFEKGWIAKIKVSDKAQLDALMDEAAYADHIKE